MEKENKIQEQKAPAVDNAKLTEEVRKQELDRVREISAIGSRHNMRTFADERTPGTPAPGCVPAPTK